MFNLLPILHLLQLPKLIGRLRVMVHLVLQQQVVPVQISRTKSMPQAMLAGMFWPLTIL